MNFVKGTAIDASGKTLTINVTDASKGNAGIAQDIDVNSSVKADKLVISSTARRAARVHRVFARLRVILLLTAM